MLHKHWRNGRAGLVSFSTELASSAATEFEDIWATHLTFIGGRALIAANKDGLSWGIDPLFLHKFPELWRASEERRISSATLVANLAYLKRVLLRSEDSSTPTTATRNLNSYL